MATNFIDYGNKAVENGIIDGGKHEILYFHAGSNNDWFNSANWYYDNAYTVPANKYPDSDDIAYIVDENVSSSRNVIIRIDYLSVTRTGYGVNWNTGPQHIEFGNGLNIESTYGVVFNNLSDYSCGYLKNYANITAPTITFNLSSNYGVINGNTSFVYNSEPCENFGNFGTVNGNASFDSFGDTYWSSAKNQGIVNGNATFYNNAANTSIINGNANFYNYSATFSGSKINGNSNFNDYSWADGATLSGDVNLYAESYAYACSIFGSVFLYNGSYISSCTIYGDVDSSSYDYYGYGNTINGNLSLTSAPFSSSTINGNVVLNGSSYTDSCTINGNATVNAYSYIYYCTINGLVELNNLSYSQYCTVSNVSLFGSSYINDSYVSNDLVANNNSSFAYNTIIDSITLNNNARSVSSNSAASATFNDNSSNDNCNLTCPSVIFNDYSSNASSSTVTGNATFNDSSDNNGTVTGNATFNDSSDNNGTVQGTLTCNTTGVCGTPSGSSTNSDLALLMHFEGGPSFEDSSLHRLAITATGTPSITSIESKFGNSSCVFNGSTDYLTTNISPSYDNDFTIDFWFMRTGVGNGQVNTILDIGNLQSAQGGLHLYTNTNGSFELNDGISASSISSVGYSTLGIWMHVAIVRKNGINTLYVNGVSLGTSNQTFPVTNNIVNIGAAPVYNFYTQGYIDELRIVKGVALYTSNFTPSTTPYQDPEPPNPSLLMHFDGSNFVDSSLNNTNIITNGNVTISSIQSKFGGSSVYFDSSKTGYLNLIHNSRPIWDLSTGDFTIEFWAYPENQNNTPYPSIFGTCCWVTPNAMSIRFSDIGHNAFNCFSVHSAQSPIANNDLFLQSSEVALNAWYHVAYVREGLTDKLFVNGILEDSHTYNTVQNWPNLSADNGPLYIASSWDGISGRYIGYLDEFRIIKGKALYTSNFLPPTAPTQNPIVPDLLLSFEGSDGSSSFVDSSPNAITVTTTGNATISTNKYRVGGSSVYFNGSNYLSLSGIPTDYLDVDFTIEAWVNINSGTINQALFNTDPHNTLGISLNRDGTGFTHVFIGNGTNWITSVVSSNTLSYGDWHHVALVRSGNTIYLYHNGILQATTNTMPSGQSGTAKISSITLFDGEFINGYVDEYRIIKGTALYTTNFNPF